MLKKYLSDDEIGLDEAGRGPLIGRVYAGAVVLGNNIKDVPAIITDSKKLSAKKREIALKWIKENVKAWGYGYAEPAEIDQINILEATNLAMKRAIEKLKVDFPECKDSNHLIIDGCYWEKRFPNYSVKSFVKGDATYISIAAASIIAKEYHDQHIKELCNNNIGLNEKYDLESNMGYGTKKHLAGIIAHGNSMYHRKSFKPCCNHL